MSDRQRPPGAGEPEEPLESDERTDATAPGTSAPDEPFEASQVHTAADEDVADEDVPYDDETPDAVPDAVGRRDEGPDDESPDGEGPDDDGMDDAARDDDLAAAPTTSEDLDTAVSARPDDTETDRTPEATPEPAAALAAALREAHAWQVAEEVVRALPADAAVSEPAEAGPAPSPSRDLPRDQSHPDGTQGTVHAPPAHVSTRPTGWHALGSALRPRATRAQVLAGVLCAVLGFAIVVQLRQNGDSTLSQLRQDDLVRLLDEASTRSDQLSREAADLQRERDQLVSGSNTRQAAIDAARRSAATQGILAGRLPAVGPGVRITVTDTGGSVRPITMLNMLEELRNAGAEAVQLNDQRITASSSFTGSTGAVQLDGTTLKAPYVWLVIGDPDTVATALDIPGGAMAYVRNDGGSGVVDKLTQVHVDALRPATTPRYATPAPAPGS